jgi:hypothetical protein
MSNPTTKDTEKAQNTTQKAPIEAPLDLEQLDEVAGGVVPAEECS